MEIELPGDFSLASTVESHGWYRLAPFDWNRRRRVLRRPDLSDAGHWMMLEVSQRRRTLDLSWSPGRAATRREVFRRITRMLQLHLDLTPFHQRCRSVPSHAEAARARFGRLLCGTRRFEDAVRIITTTNTAWRQTVRMNELLVEHYGRRRRGGDPAFPAAADLASATPALLQERCRLGYRAATIHRLATLVATGEIDLESDRHELDSAELDRFYRALPGIGPYGAAHLLAMDGRHDRIAVDTEFRRFVRQHHFSGADIPESRMCAHYEPWGEWKYMAYWWELWNEVAPAVDLGGNKQ